MVMAKSDREPWKLNPGDVSISGSSSSASTRGRGGMARKSRAEDTRSEVIRLLHRPTGIDVDGEIPAGHYSRVEMSKLRDDLTTRLWDELGRKVARHLRIPGQ